jgi:UDP-N-acetylmuramate: L-alanyl-gamma-D-glutamyl-meso-diaminopimelate ligase
MMEKIPAGERFSSFQLVEDLKRRGVRAIYRSNADLLVDEIVEQSRQGDIILIMSNGPFDNVVEKVLDRL